MEEAQEEIDNTMMGIFIFRKLQKDTIEDIWIVIEGVKVMSKVESVIQAFVALFGLIYALDLSYPDKLKYTFEFVQKVLMLMDGHKLNTKILQLKMKLFQ